MLINGIDYTARIRALTEVGIDPEGAMEQFADLGAAFAYCNQHLGVHPVGGGCTVGVLEQFPLKAPTREEALAEVRERGFRLNLEATTCRFCGEQIQQRTSDYVWAATDQAYRCPTSRNPHGSHAPVPSVPADAAGAL